MATGGNTGLSDSLIKKLSEAVEVTKMETIAISYLKSSVTDGDQSEGCSSKEPYSIQPRSVNHMEMYESEK